MEPIPNTGGGISGFIAYLLWHVYRHFPFQGTWDWLVLLVVLAVAIRILHMPFLWRLIAADMQRLARGDAVYSFRRSVLRFWWRLGSPILCVAFFWWFFTTPAGQTFLTGREFGEIRTSVSDAIEKTSVGETFAVLPFLIWWIGLALMLIIYGPLGGEAWLSKMRAQPEPQPFDNRNLLSLFFGGGVCEARRLESRPEPLEVGLLLILDPLVCLFAMWTFVFCTMNGSEGHMHQGQSMAAVAALSVFHILTSVLLEAVRMLFVYVLHKRTFG